MTCFPDRVSLSSEQISKLTKSSQWHWNNIEAEQENNKGRKDEAAQFFHKVEEKSVDAEFGFLKASSDKLIIVTSSALWY